MNDRSDERGKREENLQQICEEEHMERKNDRCGKRRGKGRIRIKKKKREQEEKETK